MKEKEIKSEVVLLESEIICVLNNDNIKKNTFHFNYHECKSPRELCYLELISCNPIWKQTFLLNETYGESKLQCLTTMLMHVKKISSSDEYSWEVYWDDHNGDPHVSYFMGITDEEVKKKFNFSNTKKNKITKIKKMPLS